MMSGSFSRVVGLLHPPYLQEWREDRCHNPGAPNSNRAFLISTRFAVSYPGYRRGRLSDNKSIFIPAEA
jgi:hypothetical protein